MDADRAQSRGAAQLGYEPVHGKADTGGRAVKPEPYEYHWGVRREWGDWVVAQGPYDNAEQWGRYPMESQAKAVAGALNRLKYLWPVPDGLTKP